MTGSSSWERMSQDDENNYKKNTKIIYVSKSKYKKYKKGDPRDRII